LPGHQYDVETGFHYNYHRYYDPRTGRYLTPDPIGLADGINLFLYAENNPINMTDPGGLFTFSGTWSIIKREIGTGIGKAQKKLHRYSKALERTFIYEGECGKELHRCLKHAAENELECLKTVGRGYFTCATLCLPTLVNPEIFVACEGACATGGFAGLGYCHLLLYAEVAVCFATAFDCNLDCEN
jgi:RHS repeat-associated protein